MQCFFTQSCWIWSKYSIGINKWCCLAHVWNFVNSRVSLSKLEGTLTANNCLWCFHSWNAFITSEKLFQWLQDKFLLIILWIKLNDYKWQNVLMNDWDNHLFVWIRINSKEYLYLSINKQTCFFYSIGFHNKPLKANLLLPIKYT